MEVQGKMCEDLKMVFFSWCALLLPCLIPYLAHSLCLRTHFCSVWWHCMSQVRLTGEKQQDRSPTTVCEHLFASSLVSDHPLSLEMCSTSAGAVAVQSQGAAQAPPHTFHHPSFSRWNLSPPVAECHIHCTSGCVLFTCTKRGSFAEGPSPPKIDSKAPGDFSGSRAGSNKSGFYKKYKPWPLLV